jgi:hypothetical protein
MKEEAPMSAVLKIAAPPAQEKSLQELVDDWTAAKQSEDAANKRRLEIEARILAVTGERDEGSQTFDLSDGRKLTVTSKITRTIDEAAWRRVMHTVPEHLRPITFVETAKLDLAGVRYLAAAEPEVYAVVAQAITAKRAKPSIGVKV